MGKPSISLVVSDDEYLAAEQLQKLLVDAAELGIDEFTSESDPGAIMRSLRTPSMFEDDRVVIIREVEAASAELQRQIIEYTQDPTPGVALVMSSAKAVAKIAAAVKKAGHVIEVAKGKRSDVFAWIRSEARARGMKIGQDAMNALLESAGEERMALAQALDHLALALGQRPTVTLEDVRLHLAARADIKIFAFIDAVAMRQTEPALIALSRLLGQGEPAQMIFWALARHLRMMLSAGEGSAEVVARRLGLPTWRAEKLVRQARGYTPEALAQAYRAVADADKKIKNSQEPEELTLERLVVQIAAGT